MTDATPNDLTIEAGSEVQAVSKHQVLYVHECPFDDQAFHIVNADTLERAHTADNPFIANIGDLRRHGDIYELADVLERHFLIELDSYVQAIEKSAGRKPVGEDLGTRLAALHDVVFDGADPADLDADGPALGLPGDDENLDQWANEDEPAAELRGWFIISRAMATDIPKDLYDEFRENLFASYDDSDNAVSAEGLPALIDALEARGYTVIRN